MDATLLRAEDLRRETSSTAAYLGIDITDAGVLADLTAVAIAQLAWRNGPVELWHSASPSRISDAEMMRANVAGTRLVRGHFVDDVVARIADALPGVRDALADPGRRLPDGRTVAEVAGDADEFQLYTEQVGLFFDRCGRLVERLRSSEVVGALACYAAAACWRWWLAPGWPSIVDKITANLQRRSLDHHSGVGGRTPPHELNLGRLRETLLAGPDRLSTAEVRICLRETFNARLPQDHGLSPRSRRLLTPAHYDLVQCLEFPGERFRQRLETRRPWIRRAAGGPMHQRIVDGQVDSPHGD